MAKIIRLPLCVQQVAIKKYFPNSDVKIFRDTELTWIGKIQPSSLSQEYDVSLNYVRDRGVKVFIIKPKPLKLAQGKNNLPHVYSTKAQQLCLYYPKTREWSPDKYFVRTIIPWACEWLLHYEIWLLTGTWCGGGIGHESEAEKISNNEQEAK